MEYQDINSKTIDRWIEDGWEWGRPVSHEDYLRALNGKPEIKLTPTRFVPREWLGNLKGKKVFGLACGGGQQIPVLTACGAECTVMDYSQKQIESEIMVAEREGYYVNALRGDMTKVFPFANGVFDIIVHPVSDCYIQDVSHVFRECFRVLKKSGVLICGFDNGINFFSDADESRIVNSMPFNPLENPKQMEILKRGDNGIQFSHTLEELIGGQLKVGFRLTDIFEDTNDEGYLKELNINTFFATRSVKD